jgi:hypothetical protein
MVTRGYLHYSHSTMSFDNQRYRDYIPAVEGGPTEADKASDRFRRLGAHPLLLPAVRAIELSVRSRQKPDPIFTLGINGCEKCHSAFAEYAPWDGRGDGGRKRRAMETTQEKLRFLRDYGRHTCQVRFRERLRRGWEEK